MPRHLGQHFLINRSAIKKIIASLSLTSGDHIIEIGPGKGALTLPIARACSTLNCSVVAIERDEAFAAALGSRVKGLGYSNAEILIGDALRLLPSVTQPSTLNPIPYKLVGNIPYAITGALLRLVSELDHRPSLAVLMLQREVAQRIVAQPPRMNLLAAITQTRANVRIIAALKPNDFIPPPTVDSAIIVLTPRADAPVPAEAAQRYKLIKIIFKQPRKTVRNNLREALGGEKADAILTATHVAPDARPQDVGNESIALMTAVFSNHA